MDFLKNPISNQVKSVGWRCDCQIGLTLVGLIKSAHWDPEKCYNKKIKGEIHSNRCYWIFSNTSIVEFQKFMYFYGKILRSNVFVFTHSNNSNHEKDQFRDKDLVWKQYSDPNLNNNFQEILITKWELFWSLIFFTKSPKIGKINDFQKGCLHMLDCSPSIKASFMWLTLTQIYTAHVQK